MLSGKNSFGVYVSGKWIVNSRVVRGIMFPKGVCWLTFVTKQRACYRRRYSDTRTFYVTLRQWLQICMYLCFLKQVTDLPRVKNFNSVQPWKKRLQTTDCCKYSFTHSLWMQKCGLRRKNRCFCENWESPELWQQHINNTPLAEYMKATEGAIASFTLNEITKLSKA